MRSLGWVYLIFVAHLVSATVTGPNYAGTVGTSPSGPATWSNTANAQGSTSDNYATVTITGSSGTQSEYLTLTNFGIDIPTGFQVAGVVVEIRWRRSGVNLIEDNAIQLIKGGTISGTNKGLDDPIPTTASISTYGGSADTWGLTFTEAEVEASNFGVAIRLDKQVGSEGGTGEVDWVRVTITSVNASTSAGTQSDRQVSAGGTDNSWTPLTNQIATLNGSFESSTNAKGENSQYLIVDNFGLSIPASHDILGISFTIHRKSTGDKTLDYAVYLVDEAGAVRTSGTNKAKGGDWPTVVTSSSYGGSTDLWGDVGGFWTPAKLNDPDFGLAIAVQMANSGSGTRRADIDYVTITVYSDVSLPVELTKFEGLYSLGKVKLNWQTATEINNDYFEVQRATVQQDFQTIGKVEGNGDSDALIDYEFEDLRPVNGINYYRLKQVDFDGKFEYSPIVVVYTSIMVPKFDIYPNPAESYVFISTNVPLSGSDLRVYNLNGTEMNLLITDPQKIDVSGLSTGLYIMKVSTPVETFNLKFVKK